LSSPERQDAARQTRDDESGRPFALKAGHAHGPLAGIHRAEVCGGEFHW
jgi:hypothetical protein